MKTVVLVSGHGHKWETGDVYKSSQYDFGAMARNYFTNNFDESYSCTLFNFERGQVESKQGKGVFKAQTSYNGRALKPITASAYGVTTINDDGDEVVNKRALKPNQENILSIADVYDYLKKTGSIAELNFFSHAWYNGPVLVSSTDRSSEFGKRDPDDHDPRMKDFATDEFVTKAHTNFSSSFEDDGVIYVRGCNVDKSARSVIAQLNRLFAGKSNKSGSIIITEVSDQLKKLMIESEQARGLEGSAKSVVSDPYTHTFDEKHIQRVYRLKTTIESMLYALYENIKRTYQYYAAVTLQKQVYGPVPGMGSEINPKINPYMYVDIKQHKPFIEFYKSQFNMEFDDDNYASFKIKEKYEDQVSGK